MYTRAACGIALTSSPPSITPVRISGPLVSSAIARGRPSDAGRKGQRAVVAVPLSPSTHQRLPCVHCRRHSGSSCGRHGSR